MAFCLFFLLGIWIGGSVVCFLSYKICLTLTTEGFLSATKSHRSNHVGAPRQIGGIILVPCSLAMTGIILVFSSENYGSFPILVLAFSAIFLLGLVDDLKGLGAIARLFFQFLISATIVLSILRNELSPNALSFLLVCLLLLACVYSINAINFMDGLDLLLVSGLVLPLVFYAILLFNFESGIHESMAILNFSTVCCLLVFSLFNWPPAKIFMGDSGSLYFGALIAASILLLIMEHGILIAITPMLYFWVDTSMTLLVRLRNGENLFEAHSKHAYQLAFRHGLSVIAIATRVFLISLWLSMIAVFMIFVPQQGKSLLFLVAIASALFFTIALRKHASV